MKNLCKLLSALFHNPGFFLSTCINKHICSPFVEKCTKRRISYLNYSVQADLFNHSRFPLRHSSKFQTDRSAYLHFFHRGTNSFYAILGRYSSKFWNIPENHTPPARSNAIVEDHFSLVSKSTPGLFTGGKKTVFLYFQSQFCCSFSCSSIAIFPSVNGSQTRFSLSRLFFGPIFFSRLVSLPSCRRYQDLFRWATFGLHWL